MNISQIEQTVMQRGYRFSRAWVADEVDVQWGQDPYGCPCTVGDLLVEQIGFEPGAVAWIDNWGPVFFEGRAACGGTQFE